jgi:uncharacterized protein YegP (UPF0339 family)
MAKFVIFRGTDFKYYWHLKAPNGEIICQSEGYNSKQGAVNGVDACKRYASYASVEDLARVA